MNGRTEQTIVDDADQLPSVLELTEGHADLFDDETVVSLSPERGMILEQWLVSGGMTLWR